MVQRVALVVICQALQLQIWRSKGGIELFGRLLELLVAVGSGARVEMQAWIVALALQQLLVFLERLVVLPGLVFAQGAGWGALESCGQEHQQQDLHCCAEGRLGGRRGRRFGFGLVFTLREEQLHQQQDDRHRQRPMVALVILAHEFFLVLSLGQFGQTLVVERVDGLGPAQGQVKAAFRRAGDLL